MSNTKVMSPYRQTDGQTDRQDRQTDEHIIFEAHYTMGPSGNYYSCTRNRFLLICIELFGFNEGNEWLISNHLIKKVDR